MGIGSARGEDRAVKAAELAIASPLLEASIDGAHGVLLSIQGGSDLGLFEINEAARLVQEVAHPEANIIFGAVIDDALGDEARVTVIAAGFDDVKATSPSMDQSQPQAAPQRPAAPAAAPASAHPQNGNHQGGGNHQQNVQPIHAGVGAAGLSNWGQQRPSAVPADSGFDVDLPSVVEPDLTGTHPDDLDVPDFLK
jgi:cell division protein FtsZ